jgi:hypothetical protein
LFLCGSLLDRPALQHVRHLPVYPCLTWNAKVALLGMTWFAAQTGKSTAARHAHDDLIVWFLGWCMLQKAAHVLSPSLVPSISTSLLPHVCWDVASAAVT